MPVDEDRISAGNCLGPTRFPIQWAPEVKRPGRGNDNSFRSRAALHVSGDIPTSPTYLHCVYRDNFTFTFTFTFIFTLTFYIRPLALSRLTL